jgi:predicted regulator of Ras-like GTPase activity (Roadblock/LC7/MglB family)
MSMNPDILQKIDAIFDECRHNDRDLIALAMISTDGRLLCSTFNDEILIQRLAALFTALHEIGTGLYEACHRKQYAEACWVKFSEGPLISIPLNYGLVVASLRASSRFGGNRFILENLQQMAAYIDTLISTGQEPPPPKWKYGF